MLKYIIALGVVLVLAGLIIQTSKTIEVEKTETTTTTEPKKTQRNNTVECVTNMDCGQSGYTDYYCLENFVVRDYIRFRCVEEADGDMTCNKIIEKDFKMWCRQDEICTEGIDHCEPKISCKNKVKDQGEKGIDCGGPCTPCSSCNNAVKDGDEEDVDCGGSLCDDCKIECTTNGSCGIPRWGRPYCGKTEDNIDIVVRDYIKYECKNPG